MVNTAKFIDQAITEIRDSAAGRGVVMALSGGVDRLSGSSAGGKGNRV